MASIDIPLYTYEPFTGAGASSSIPFYMMYPPEYGCFGLGMSTSPLATTVHAEITDQAKVLLARSIVDGTSIKVTHFAFGAGGYDPIDPLRALMIDTAATSLDQETYRKVVDVYENPSLDSRTRSFAARLSRTEFVGGIGEFALIATILHSPISAEVGTRFTFAIGHQGLRAKSTSHVETYRILITV